MKPFEEYRKSVEISESILNRKLQEAFAEIEEEVGSTPLHVEVHVVPTRQMNQSYPRGVYSGCQVSFIP